jgi:PAS domain S-box-containing protein
MVKFFSSLTFANKYALALSFIALLSILAFFNLSTLIDSQRNDGEVINMSGKQRMLSQKIALLSMKKDLKELQDVVVHMESSHKKLLSISTSPRIYNCYYQQPSGIDVGVKKYLQAAKSYIDSNATSQEALGYIVAHSEELLKKLDKVVYLYQQEAEQKIDNLHTNEIIILILTLTALLLEALFIFRPIDISVKRKTAALRQEKEYSNTITQANTNAIIAVDKHFKILTFNTSAERIFGYSAEEMIGTTLLDDRIIPAKYLQGHISGLKAFMKNGELKNKDVVFELEGRHKETTLFPIRISFGIKVDENQKIVVANIQDISLEKEQEMMMLQQSRLAAMGEMIANIAHQWRQPLSAISTIATGAKLRYSNKLLSDEELLEIFDKIKHHTLYLSKTIDDFRDFFSREESDERFELNELIQRSILLIEDAFKSHTIELHYQLSKEPLHLKGRANELSQVLLNILNNAKDALNANEGTNRMVLIETLREDDKCYINIYDSAGGIDEKIKLKIFEPYFTTKHKSEGTGIGLFMSSKIINQHFNGVLSASNEEFVINNETYYGAKFTIVLNFE